MNDYIGEWPTNRGQHTPDSGVGVDTLVLRGPTTEALGQELLQQRLRRDLNTCTGVLNDVPIKSYEFYPIGLTEARIEAETGRDQAFLNVELSLPNMMWGHNCSTLSLEMLPEAADAVLGYLGEVLPGVPRVHETRVARIDLTRDFHDLSDPAAVLRVLGARHAPTATRHNVYRGADGQVQTVSVGTKSGWTVRAYDKQREVQQVARSGDEMRRMFNKAWAVASAGILRCEAQLRTPVLTQMGLSTIADCTPSSLKRAATKYFAKPGWDLPYGGSRIHDTLKSLRGQVTRTEYRNLVLLVLAHSAGVPHDLSRHSYETARALAHRHRLLDATDGGLERRLDFVRGREVTL